MANRDMKVSVLVQLVDRLTAPLRGMTRGIAGVANRIGDLGRRIGLIGSALAALSFMAPIQQAAAWDAQLRDIAITAGKTGGAVETMIGDIGKRYEKLALETGQRSMDLAKGAQTLVASGMDAGLIDKLMPTIGRVATAANATIEDTAKTAFALSDALKVAPDQMEAALAKLVTAGKLGRFEFKNMAAEFPGLTAQMAKFGITGMEAVETLGASLQIAMLGTANPSEAATNLTNFLTKINAPEAIKKFEKELKVDVTGVMTDAAAKGINPIEAVLEKMSSKLAPQQAEIDKIMKKAGISDKQREEQIKTLLAGTKVGKLYADMQVLGFVLPFLQNREKYLAFRKEIAASGVDVIANDFSSRMRGLAQSLQMFGELGTQAMRRIGIAFASNLPAANRALTSLLQWVSAIDAKWPGLIDGVLSWTGGLLALGAGIAVLTPVLSALVGTLGLILSPLLLLATPIGAAVAGFAALAAAATYLWLNWSTVAPQITALWDSVTAAIAAKLAEIVTSFQQFPAYIVATFAPLASTLQQAGMAAIQSLWDGMTTKFGELLGWIQGIPARILAAIGSIDLSNVIKWPTLPNWLGGSKPAAPGGTSVPGTMDGFNPTSAPWGVGGQSGFTRTAGGPAANSNVQVGGRIVVEAAEGTRIVNVQSENPAVPVTPNRGSMLGRA
ncbi:phage tail tape measure protein [Bosea sp. (in: a-proteobacteria)]|uniref:phage tail tape measure protein n=1 Tax=Bosea sp. (in: a-proteobacteria) TaxID=1871050 RepID=UPI0027349946|nr:phage tail tape measure protein [Bosea sp. (in: a-proteobacteria)]MDP3408188.1 phage tail tape measure protein [Bosea sp. (in: a-proteobacteria)]